MSEERMRMASSRLTSAQRDELELLSRLPDDAINTDDIPEQQEWTNGKRGLFVQSRHDELAVRVDADVVAWFRAHATDAESYEARINHVLRAFVALQTGET